MTPGRRLRRTTAIRAVRAAFAVIAFTATTAATEHLHLFRNDLGRVTIGAVLCLPLACTNAPFDVHR